METVLYYTFSTIAQTLAAAIALLAAFILYRRQSLDASLETQLRLIWRQFPDDVQHHLEELSAEGQYSEFLEYVRRNAALAHVQLITASQHRAETILRVRVTTLHDFRGSLLLTVSLIVASVLVVSLSPLLGPLHALSAVVLGVGQVWFLLCLMSYVRLIRASLG